ncbi:MAG: hypothetical protein PHN31_00010 [Candidatus Gracilibacteria bacterium]|nr:hypothetical protein [Candidatus Gracilibacteria bacterium]
MEKTVFKNVTKQKLYDITLESANSKDKEIYIFEKGNMGDLVGYEDAEKLRKVFLKNNIKVKQITNEENLISFSDNKEFIEEVMSMRYVPQNKFFIDYEILIFDDIVAVYDTKELLVIKNERYARIQKSVFMNYRNNGKEISIDKK